MSEPIFQPGDRVRYSGSTPRPYEGLTGIVTRAGAGAVYAMFSELDARHPMAFDANELEPLDEMDRSVSSPPAMPETVPGPPDHGQCGAGATAAHPQPGTEPVAPVAMETLAALIADQLAWGMSVCFFPVGGALPVECILERYDRDDDGAYAQAFGADALDALTRALEDGGT